MENPDARLESLIKSHPIPTWRPYAWAIMAVMAVGIAWGFATDLDEVTVAEGKVVPLGDLKVVQHLDGGIIERIYVREGATVKEGEPLIQLDVRSAGLSQEELEVQLFGQMAIKARLEAEAADRAPIFPPEIIAKRPQLVEAQQAAYKARKEELEATTTVLRNVAQQREQEVKDLTGKLQSTARTLDLMKQRFADSEQLLKSELTPRAEHLKLQAEVANLQQTYNSTRSGIVSAEAAVREAQGRIRERQDAFRREVNTEMGKVDEKIAQLREQLQLIVDKGARLEIRSPISGIVKNMRHTTVGGVVKPGEPIMEIVPIGEKLVITAKLNPIDRGYIKAGQPAKVKLTTYDFTKYGTLDGKVARVAADATQDPELGPIFEVVVETDRSYLGQKEGELPITPGMQATVDIYTGHKTAIDFLIKPVIKMDAASFEAGVREGTGGTTSDSTRTRRPVIN